MHLDHIIIPNCLAGRQLCSMLYCRSSSRMFSMHFHGMEYWFYSIVSPFYCNSTADFTADSTAILLLILLPFYCWISCCKRKCIEKLYFLLLLLQPLYCTKNVTLENKSAWYMHKYLSWNPSWSISMATNIDKRIPTQVGIIIYLYILQTSLFLPPWSTRREPTQWAGTCHDYNLCKTNDPRTPSLVPSLFFARGGEK